PPHHVQAARPWLTATSTAIRRSQPSPAGGERAGGLAFSATLSPQWQAMRGPHGGYLAAILLRALIATAAEDTRAPRSLTVHYARAAGPGAVLIRTALERRGRSLSTLSARMEQDGATIALALAAFSVPWSGPELERAADAARGGARRRAGELRRRAGGHRARRGAGVLAQAHRPAPHRGAAARRLARAHGGGRVVGPP